MAAIVLSAAVAACATGHVPTGVAAPRDGDVLAALAIPVTRAENRAVSFTNKESAYWYTQTHRNDHPEHAWFRGLNIAGRRIFNDYQVVVAGTPLESTSAQVVVTPDALVRTYPSGVVETLSLFDRRDALSVRITGGAGEVALRLSGDQLAADGREGGIDFYRSTSGGEHPSVDHVAVGRVGERFIIAVGATRGAARALVAEASAHATEWERARKDRLAGLVSGDRGLATDDARLTDALRWITLTTDELVTKQRGDGIYAGLPWFNEYWGRDSFISLAGATLVTGHFEEARAILVSFAQFQELDHASPFYGRLPNIVKPGSVDYHTTDGTPRWVIALRDYVRYSGDRSIVTALYPNVTASIEGALAHWTDSSGYLVHADNETWMDARREPDHAAFAPRGTRANDVQALWHDQLRDGAELAAMVGDTASASRWSRAADRLAAHFARDFVDVAGSRIADRLDARAAPDFTLRPNLFFATGLIGDESLVARATRRAWESLVYPWGVSTLDQADPFFHPYHLASEHYPKDEAYHNGAVWIWLDGIAIQRMVELGQVDAAWPLFQYTSKLALRRGDVGGLAETMDAYPHPGEAEPRLTGTFLQAWSNAELLRVWYQDLLGIKPDLVHGALLLAPRLPAGLGMVDVSVRIGAGTLAAHFGRTTAGGRRYAYHLSQQSARVTLDLPTHATGFVEMAAGDSLVAEERGDVVDVRLVSSAGDVRRSFALARSVEREQRKASLDAILRGLRFATPRAVESHPVMHRTAGEPARVHP